MAFRFGPGPLLDSFPGAQAAYSLRKVNSRYTGPCLTVRRSSDNATTDIGFFRYTVDTDAILNFVGSGNGFVTTWFDQSGNGINISQGTTSLQFNISTSGSLHYEGNDVVMNATTNRGFNRNTNTVSLSDWTAYFKSKTTGTAAYTGPVNLNIVQNNGANIFGFRQASDSVYKIVGGTNTAYVKRQMKRTSSTGDLQGYLNGVSTGTSNTAETLNLSTGTRLFGEFAGQGWVGTVREAIIYPVTHTDFTIAQINNMM
jgi:hypothetical protein